MRSDNQTGAGGRPPRAVRKAALLATAIAVAGGVWCGHHDTPRTIGRDGIDFLTYRDSARAFQPSVGTPGGTFVFATSHEPTTFNPYSPAFASHELTSLLFSGLIRIDGATGETAPCLAKRWERSADGTSWTFHLHPGLRWSDSTAVTADDVVFTFVDIVQGIESVRTGVADRLGLCGDSISVEALDSLTVRFTLSRPCAVFLEELTLPVLPRHIVGRYVRDGRFDRAMHLASAADSVVGTGPFIVASYIPTRRVVLARNPCYHEHDRAGNRLPYLDSIVCELLPEENTKQVRFRGGDLDYYQARGRDYELLVEDSGASYDIYCLGPSRSATAFVLNLTTDEDSAAGAAPIGPVKQRWFADVLVRRALSCAVDREHIVSTIMHGAGFVQELPGTTADSLGLPVAGTAIGYDTARARELLAQAGFRDTDNDGVLEDGNGDALAFTVLANSGNVMRVSVAEQVCRDFGAVGVRAILQLVDYAALRQRLTAPPYAWEAAVVGLELPLDPLAGWRVWHSSGRLHLWHPSSNRPVRPWERRLDSILTAALSETDQAQRRQLYAQWQSVIEQNVPMVLTGVPERILCISKRFGNVNPSLVGGLLHNIDEIYVPDVPREERLETAAPGR